ncbi:hypothetical protein [Microterricola viridarii]|uniref:hypothetical protein n=1 Tax=Microterricola viridarii TaxID=412690 RepID=UPI0012EACE54|nr:hypothetical protein [Microterricola viridarii]
MTVQTMPHLGGCNPGAIAGTFALGVGLGGVAGALIAIGAHLLHAFSSSSGAATQSLMMSIIFSTFGGFVFGLAASVGAL